MFHLFRKKQKENPYGISRSEIDEKLKKLAFEIDDATIIQEKLESDKIYLREKIERLRSEGKSSTSLAPLIVDYKNLSSQKNFNIEKTYRPQKNPRHFAEYGFERNRIFLR